MKGLQFKALDLHIHTPASSDFQRPDGKTDLEIAQMIVQESISKGLNGIAITDHNSGEWIDLIKESAKGTSLSVFPGVELACSGGAGIHILAIFDITKTKEHIKALLSRLELKPEDHGKETTVINKSPNEVIGEIVQCDAVPILAHINSSHGVFEEMKGVPRINVIQDPNLLVVEATDCQNEEKKNKSKRVIDFLNGKDINYQRKLAVIQSSDNPVTDSSHGHSIEGIGKRFTYYKMEEVNLNSLKNCFFDPEVRIRYELISELNQFPIINKTKIVGGFLDNVEIEFHSGLNSIIGSKGSGKSLLIEFLRFVLNQVPVNKTLSDDHDSKLSNKLKLYGEIEIELMLETGNKLTLKRQYDPANNSPYLLGNEYDISRIFPVLFLSQNEIIKIAEDEEEQLNFIDRFFDFHEFQEKIHEYENDLEDLDNSFANSIDAYIQSKEIETRIKTKETQLSDLDTTLKNDIFDKYALSEVRQQNISNTKQYVVNLKQKINSAKKLFDDVARPIYNQQIANEPLIKRMNDILNQAKEKVDTRLIKLENELGESGQLLNQESSDAILSHKKIATEYENYVKKTGGNYQTLAGKRQILNKEINELQQKMNLLKERLNKLNEINLQRKTLLDAIEKQRNDYTNTRRDRCKLFEQESAHKLKIEIQESSNVVEFRDTLLQLKKGSYLRDADINSICDSIIPREFIHNLIRYSIDREPSRLKPILDKINIEQDKLRALANFLLEEYNMIDLLKMQYKVSPQDRPLISYLLESGSYAPLSQLSIGQKSTALLIMALSNGKMPIVIDQPEDSLDLKTVWSDVCLKLRNGKEQRQFIFTTHNSSVAVASDSDNFIILESDANKSELKFRGSMDNSPVADEVIDYLEGGIDTYNLKRKKYNIPQRIQN